MIDKPTFSPEPQYDYWEDLMNDKPIFSPKLVEKIKRLSELREYTSTPDSNNVDELGAELLMMETLSSNC